MGKILKIPAIQVDKSIPVGLRVHSNDAGLDLICQEPIKLFSMQTTVIPTNLRILIPEELFGWVCPRSGLSTKGLLVHIGTIDADYTGVVGVIMTNLSRKVFNFNPGDRIGQLVILNKVPYELDLQDEEFPLTERGNGGFGHTGISA